jgi:RHH-type proline utilization regulon transcriptional repressor/proline dehydrogenase/delta 1-pyrroline-5-carboxylate dehydrogenase
VLVDERITPQFRRRLAGAVALLTVGHAERLATQVPALIEAEAQARLNAARAQAAQTGRILAQAQAGPQEGHFVAPAAVCELPADSELLQRELFGPLLCVKEVRGVEEACAFVDALPHALTGGLFTRHPGTVRQVRALTPVGNLYVNRGTTGAIVGRHPFGGNRLSGTGAKAGGPDYLLQFVEPHAFSENTLRHGLVVAP